MLPQVCDGTSFGQAKFSGVWCSRRTKEHRGIGIVRFMTSRYLRIALIVGSVVGLLSASYLYSALSDQSLSASPLVSEAVNRVREHPGAVEALGESIDASGSVKGTVREYKS